MFPGVNPKDMQKAMKKMGVKQEEIPALEVVIKTNEGNLLIKDPQVMKVEMMGQESFQITGELVEESGISGDDVKMVVEQAGVSEEEAREALEKSDGDLAEAILNLQNT
tara:strand:+ start:400 stop:726 length:327 start_codon:yes stop_codon:yes gene_type:complete